MFYFLRLTNNILYYFYVCYFRAITRARESGMNDAMAEPAKQQAPSSGSGGGGDVVLHSLPQTALLPINHQQVLSIKYYLEK